MSPVAVVLAFTVIALLFATACLGHNLPSLATVPYASGDLKIPFIAVSELVEFLFKTHNITRRGFLLTKDSAGVFKLPLPDRWMVFLTSKQCVEDVAKASPKQLSSFAAFEQLLQLSHTLDPSVLGNPYHIPLIGTKLTKNMDSLLPDMMDEIDHAFKDLMEDHDNVSFKGMETFSRLICRVSNRVFVGKEKCRDPRYIDLNVRFARRSVAWGYVLGYVPSFIRPLVARILFPASEKKAMAEHLRSLIASRRPETCHDKDDFLTWVLEAAPKDEQNETALSLRMLHLNFAAIHSTSTICAQMFFSVASNAAWQDELYVEVKDIVEISGWTKEGLSRMVKLDSFIKEVLRFYGVSSVSMSRIAVNDFTFSNGITLSPGTLIVAAAREFHLHQEADSMEFKPFRYLTPSTNDGPGASLVHTALDYLPWGHGRHGCPGRFFAANELKGLLANAILNFNISLEDRVSRPEDLWFVSACYPNPKVQMHFSRRG